ncbi:uroporphyrinogen-III C-methyltransferase [Marinicellulosiphila megalodicopiae]|uniref:uroporphyrinogen-III C-methyltransferase n=1 Tax=Marinicellulosiphila megalodicopiae TaxID=2724896 RepID=UPI003BAF9F23
MSDQKDLNEKQKKEAAEENIAQSAQNHAEEIIEQKQTPEKGNDEIDSDDILKSEEDLEIKKNESTNTQFDDLSENPSGAQTSKSKENESKSKTHPLKSYKFIVILILIVMCGVIVFYLSQNFKKQDQEILLLKNELNTQIKTLDAKYNYQQAIDKLIAQDAKLQANIIAVSAIDNTTLQTQLTAQNKELEILRQQLIQAATQFNRSEQFKTIEWQLAEAKYLLRIAQQRIVMEKDVNSALSVIKAVDDLFVNTGDVSLYNLREVLAQDKAALESVKSVDLEGVYIQLGNIRNQVEQFNFVLNLNTENTQENKSFMQRVMSSIKVRDISEQYVGQLDPVLHNIAKQTLVLMLEQAQAGLLNNQQDVFELAVKKSKTQLNQYFSNEAQFDWMTQQLNSIQSLRLNQNIPDVLNSINALDQYLINLSE